eukprot:Anaeramoba_ignava/c21259_g1_i1.p3 GENE.c21259_g1_i1~~c21259_g1_i1.p3  ORF type:complete len:133 (-),score=23.88 c21259_g1_i1:2310-2708(-)
MIITITETECNLIPVKNIYPKRSISINIIFTRIMIATRGCDTKKSVTKNTTSAAVNIFWNVCCLITRYCSVIINSELKMKQFTLLSSTIFLKSTSEFLSSIVFVRSTEFTNIRDAWIFSSSCASGFDENRIC